MVTNCAEVECVPAYGFWERWSHTWGAGRRVASGASVPLGGRRLLGCRRADAAY